QTFPFIGVAVVIASALNRIAGMQAYFRLFTGTRHISTGPLQVGLRERFAVLTLSLLILGGGVYPQPGVASRHHAPTTILQQRENLNPNAELSAKEPHANPTE